MCVERFALCKNPREVKFNLAFPNRRKTNLNRKALTICVAFVLCDSLETIAVRYYARAASLRLLFSEPRGSQALG